MRVRIILGIFLFCAGTAIALFSTRAKDRHAKQSVTNNTVNTVADAENTNGTTNVNTPVPANENVNTIANTVEPKPDVVVPVQGFFDRITKKPFGIYITPKTSPVQPEKFTGYHTGADAETTPEEQTVDAPVFAMTSGTVTLAGHVNGYGGVIMIRSEIENETVTVLYGHLRIASLLFKAGEHVNVGDHIANLGAGYSAETDGERKHLHLGILKGASTNVKGYVQTKPELSGWYDPVVWLKEHSAR